MPKQPVRYCSIMRWIEDQHSEFADAINSACINRMLNLDSRQKKQSVTFLYPSEKVRNSIIKLVESNPEEAAKQLNAMIIHKYIGSLDSFDGCYNMLEVVFRPTGKTKGSIFLGKAEIVASKFPVRTDYAERLAVWQIKNDEIPPVSGESRTVLRKASSKKKKSSKKGRGSEFDNCNENSRCQMMGQILNMNVVRVAVSLLCRLQKHHDGEFQKVLKYGMVTSNPVATLFLILEPNRQDDPFISKNALDDFVVHEAYCGVAPEQYDRYVKMSQVAHENASDLDQSVESWVKFTCMLIRDKSREGKIGAANCAMGKKRGENFSEVQYNAAAPDSANADAMERHSFKEAVWDENDNENFSNERGDTYDRPTIYSDKQKKMAEQISTQGGCPCEGEKDSNGAKDMGNESD